MYTGCMSVKALAQAGVPHSRTKSPPRNQQIFRLRKIDKNIFWVYPKFKVLGLGKAYFLSR
ncbi:MAG: hypothetical protein A3C07_01115 [Candidatus Sungbacteria bacterium RIFCSPHIGHO2_02_FULL_47_11]|uniref:Uncharacterized protein n=1 Tax=Candidatus Sungbacteria bacterium RIFCSPHIGHO2_02_FULL_47_11 TaxID=1802270 RepID=A0A1G2KM19_9BACT|nr:MAG: hypothetical protein A3C07_01115 [Candidatus Sungbacteria bacterium RIFCSPHIGHO2_02_FULL_47_11]